MRPVVGAVALNVSVPDESDPDVELLVRPHENGGRFSGPQVLVPGERTLLSPGRYCFASRLPGGAETEEVCRDLEEGEQTLEYGAVRVLRSRDEHILGLDGETGSLNSDNAVVALLGHPRPVPLLPGAVTWAVLPPFATWEVNVREGEVVDLDLGVAEGRRVIRLLPSVDRELPTQPDVDRNVCLYREGRLRVCAEFPSTDRPIVGFLPPAGSFQYEIRVGVTRARVPEEDTAFEFQLERLDLYPVRVVVDGGETSVLADVNVRLIESFDGVRHSNSYEADSLETGFGIDVMPGTYRVLFDYVHPVDDMERVVEETISVGVDR